MQADPQHSLFLINTYLYSECFSYNFAARFSIVTSLLLFVQQSKSVVLSRSGEALSQPTIRVNIPSVIDDRSQETHN